jgi:sugar/nucleoside kinase (ribokinase family)
VSGPAGHKVLCVGRIYCDLVFSGLDKIPSAGEEVYAENIGIHAGGGAYITAAYLAAAGRATGLCAVYPAGPFGAAIKAEIAGAGIELTHCTNAAPGSDPQLTVAISLPADRAFLTKRSGPAIPDSIAAAMADPTLKHLHIAELATLAEHPDLAAMAHRHGLSVSLDCSWDERILRTVEIGRILRDVDLFLPNEAELMTLFALAGAPQDHRARITDTVPLVALKRGARGSCLLSRDSCIDAPALASEVSDTTGAGDAFNAGFIAAWLQGQDGASCLRQGNAFGAIATRQPGGASGAADIAQRNRDRKSKAHT